MRLGHFVINFDEPHTVVFITLSGVVVNGKQEALGKTVDLHVFCRRDRGGS